MSAVPRPTQILLVGQKIRQIRKSRHLTQTDLATRIGVTQSDLSRMENGEYKVGLDTLFKILQVFELPMSRFFDEASAGTPPASSAAASSAQPSAAGDALAKASGAPYAAEPIGMPGTVSTVSTVSTVGMPGSIGAPGSDASDHGSDQGPAAADDGREQLLADWSELSEAARAEVLEFVAFKRMQQRTPRPRWKTEVEGEEPVPVRREGKVDCGPWGRGDAPRGLCRAELPEDEGEA